MIKTEICGEDFDIGALTEEVRNRLSGAIVTFVGVVRDDGVKALEYESYEEMAEKKLNELAREVKERFRLNDVVIVHRTGRLEVGENVVFIAVSASHRTDAFEGCRHIIDTIKETVPIWKEDLK